MRAGGTRPARAAAARARKVAIADARDLRDAGRHGDARVDEARDRAHLLAALEPHRSDLDDARARADSGRLEVDDRPDGARQRRARRGHQADEADASVVVADKARVVAHHLLQHPPGELARDARKSQEGARRPFRRERLAGLLDQGRQAVGCPSSSWSGATRGPRGGGVRRVMRTHVRMFAGRHLQQSPSRRRRPRQSAC